MPLPSLAGRWPETMEGIYSGDGRPSAPFSIRCGWVLPPRSGSCPISSDIWFLCRRAELAAAIVGAKPFSIILPVGPLSEIRLASRSDAFGAYARERAEAGSESRQSEEGDASHGTRCDT